MKALDASRRHTSDAGTLRETLSRTCSYSRTCVPNNPDLNPVDYAICHTVASLRRQEV